MTSKPGPKVRSDVRSTDEQDRGDRSAFGDLFRRLFSLAAEILPGTSTRQALETRLGLSGSRISKDVRSLDDIGIEVSRSGHKYVVTGNQFPVLVACEEADALHLAHQALVKAGLPEEKHLGALIARIPRAIRSAIGDCSGEQGGIEFPQALVDSHPYLEQINRLRKAIRGGKMIRFRYQSQRARRAGGEASSRLVDRAELVYIGTVYLNGWEALEDGTFQARTFRLDRIAEIEALPSAVSKPSPPEFEYVYRLSAAMSELATTPPGATAIRLEDGRLEVRTKAKTDLLARMNVLRYGADAEVIAPEALRTAVADSLAKGAAQYARPLQPTTGE